MQVQILRAEHQTYDGSRRYFFIDMECGKRRASIVVEPEGIRVCVLNASHRAYGGMGRQFDTAEQAIEAYRSGAVKEMIRTAVEAA